jgi:hypothetical protein
LQTIPHYESHRIPQGNFSIPQGNFSIPQGNFSPAHVTK